MGAGGDLYAGPVTAAGVLAGQHADKILAELGYGGEAIGSLFEGGVVWANRPEG